MLFVGDICLIALLSLRAYRDGKYCNVAIFQSPESVLSALSVHLLLIIIFISVCKTLLVLYPLAPPSHRLLLLL